MPSGSNIRRWALCAGLAISVPAWGQEAPVAPLPPPDRGDAAAAPAGNPAVLSLMQADGISRAEAEERIALQADILALLQNSALLDAAGFVDLAVQHRPVYQVWLNFVDNRDKSALLKEIPPKLRRYVKIRKAKHPKAERRAGFNALTGLACGKVVTTNYDWRGTGSSSFVKLSSTAQGDLSQGGDSGAPVFAYVNPSTTRDISATGIHVAGAGSGSTATAVYMPIDRIFEVGVSNLKLVTTPW